MEELIRDIDDLKDKIINEIKSFSFHSDLSYVTEILLKEINSYEYDEDNILSLKKYRAFLESFYETVIVPINKMIVDQNNKSIFDTSKEEDNKEITLLEKEIEELLKYIKENLPTLGEDVSEKYKKLKDKHHEEFEYTINATRRRFNIDKGIENESLLSLYSDTLTLERLYLNKLKAFKTVHIDDIKIFIDNDKRIKEIFKKAYETLTEKEAQEAIKKLEENYLKSIEECMKSDIAFSKSDILKVQDSMIKNGLQLDSLVNKTKEKNSIYERITKMTLNTELKDILELESYVEKNGLFAEEFHKNLYAIIEKEKYACKKRYREFVIYPKLSKKSQNVLENIFLERLKECSEEEAYNILVSLKKYGFLETLDKEYEEFFDKRCLIKNSSTIEMKPIENKIYIFDLKFVVNDRDVPVLTFKDKSKKDLKLGRDFNYYEGIVGDLIKLRFKNNKGTSFKYVDLRTGKFVKNIKNPKTLVKKYALGKYIVSDYNNDFNDFYQDLYDSNFNLILKHLPDGSRILVDYTREDFLIVPSDGKGTYYLCNKEFTVSTGTCLSEEFKDCINICPYNYNDGILAMSFFKEIENDVIKFICYYDLINKKVIDTFQIDDKNAEPFVYSEGLYTYYDKNNNCFGFKNLKGDIVIKLSQKDIRIYPFFHGIAWIVNDDDNYFINKDGDRVETDKDIHFSVDLDDRRYVGSKNHILNEIRLNDNFMAYNNTPIMELDISNNAIHKLRKKK